MRLKIQHIVIFITIIALLSCRDSPSILTEIHGSQVHITDSLPVSDSLEAFIKPYREHVNEELDRALSYAPHTIAKTDGTLNSSAGNLMADIVMAEASPVFRSREGKAIDFTLLNYGGIRSVISPGPVSARTAYEVMPFENTIVVAELDGKTVRELVAFLLNADRPHPISGLQIVINPDRSLQQVNIQGVPFDENRTYYVATSNYLAEGGDAMGFFKNSQKLIATDYSLRNAIIDYFKKKDTLQPKVDDRFVIRPNS